MTRRVRKLKREQLRHVADHRDALRRQPCLRWLFFEITSRCNLGCRHCGSSCTAKGEMLGVADVENTLQTLTTEKPMVCLTGGEPMVHPNFFEIANRVHALGFSWGMTTNATLIDENAATALKQAGMRTVSVSLDGMETSHDLLRGKKGAWRSAVGGIEALMKAGFQPQVTTVFHRENFDQMEPLYCFLSEMGVTDWRPINVEPIGRACESGDLLLAPEQLAHLLSFIRSKRFDPACKMNVTFGCSHYLGVDAERMVRDHYFLCGAGITVASVRSNGDVCGCLDIANRPELVQGNIKNEPFLTVWENRFEIFRRDRTLSSAKCAGCAERCVCGGDSAHTWDYEKNEPLLCYKDFGCALEQSMK